jgi:hypothetical protein
MKSKQSEHARQVVERFQSILADAGETLSEQHSDELALLVEAALDASLVEQLEKMAVKLEAMAHDLRHDERFFVSTD